MKYIQLLVVPLLLSACAQLEVIAPNPRVEPPETRGEAWKFKIGGTASSSHRYEATNDASKRPPSFENAAVFSDHDIGPAGYFSLAPRFEIGVEYSVRGEGASVMGKLQVLGDGTLTAKEENIPVAVFVRAGSAHGSNSGDQNGVFGPGGYNWKGKMDTSYFQAGVSAGYRPKNWLLVWGGAAAGKYWADVKITQERSNNGVDAGGTYSKDATGDGYTGSLGAMFSWPKFQVYVAGEQVRIDYNDSKAKDQTSVHVGVFFTP